MMYWYAIPTDESMNQTIHLSDMPKEKTDLLEQAKIRVRELVKTIRSLPSPKVELDKISKEPGSEQRRRHN